MVVFRKTNKCEACIEFLVGKKKPVIIHIGLA